MNELRTIESAVVSVQTLRIREEMKAALLTELGPVADRIESYVSEAAQCHKVSSDAEATRYAGIMAQIDADAKTVANCKTLQDTKKTLDGLHKIWTRAEASLTTPLKLAKNTMKSAVMDYQAEVQRQSQERQRKLQAEADAKARKERDRLEAQAASAKRPETAERKMEEAAQIIAPTIVVEAPKFVPTRKVWQATITDPEKFWAAVALDANLRGFVDVSLIKMQRAKAANNMMLIDGVRFEQVNQ